MTSSQCGPAAGDIWYDMTAEYTYASLCLPSQAFISQPFCRHLPVSCIFHPSQSLHSLSRRHCVTIVLPWNSIRYTKSQHYNHMERVSRHSLVTPVLLRLCEPRSLFYTIFVQVHVPAYNLDWHDTLVQYTDFAGTTRTDRSFDRARPKRRDWTEHSLPLDFRSPGTNHST